MSQRWWLLLLVVFCVFAGPAFGQTIEFLDAQGNSLSGPYFEGSRAYLRVVDPAVSASVDAQVAASMSGDVEMVSLAETGAGTGVFEGSIELSIWTPAPADGRLQTSRDASHYPYTFDSVTATYGAASDTANLIGSTVEITDATGNPAETFLVGDRLYFRVMDAAANSSTWIAETTYVIVHATVGNREEYETPIVTETGPDTSIFEGSIQTVLGGDPVTEDGIFELAPGDLAEVQHLDANGQTDSLDQAGALSNLAVTVEWVDESGQPLSQVYEFSSPSVRVTDGALAGLGSLSVRLTSDLRGDEEWLTLWEDSSNPGVFSSGVYLPGTSLPDPPAQDGWLEVTENPGPPLQRDTVRAFHESCSTPPCPTDAVSMIGTTTRLTDSQWSDVEMAIPGSPIFIEVIDYSRPYDFSTTATIASQAGDSEIVSLDSAYDDPYQPRYDAFRGSIDVEVGPVVQGDGVLQVQEPDTITASHPDPFYFSFSTDSAVVVAATMIEFLDRFGNPADYQFEDSPVRVRAVYPDGNTDPGAADAVTVTLLTKDSEGNTRDTETLQLTETGPDTGVFTGQINHLAYYQTYPENGTLESWYTYNGPGTPSLADSVTVVLDSASATVPFLFSKVWFIDAAGNEATQYSLGERIYMRAERENANNSPLQANYLWIQVSSLTTGDFESVTLTETGPDTAVFEGWIDSAELPAAWDQVLGVQTGETIEMIHQGYMIQVKDQAVITVNQPPVAGDDAASLTEDTSVSIPVLANDSDPENAPLGLHRIETDPAHGTVEMEASGSILYTPAQNYYGTDSFQYRVHDGVNSVVGMVMVTISPVSDPPVAVDDFVTTPEDTPITVNALANDTDADGDALTISSYMPGACGTVMLNPDNTFTYTPEPNCYTPPGTPGYIMHQVSDGTSQDIGYVHLTVTPVNDPPVAVDDTATTAEDTIVSIYVRDNDSDADGDTVWISNVTQGAHGQVGASATFINYLAEANYHGTDTFTYTINDSNGNTATGRVNLTITAVNDAPNAVDDSATTQEDRSVPISVKNNDSDVDGDFLTITAVTQGAHGTVTFTPGAVNYIPATNYNGNDSFTYTLSDGKGGTDSATVTVTITPVQDFPIAVNDSATTAEEAPVVVDVLLNDSDPDGDSLTLHSVTEGASGSVTFNSSYLTYAPNVNFNGADSFTYTIRDSVGQLKTATVTVTVTGVNDAPIAANDSGATAEDTALTLNVLANDSDIDGDTLVIVAVTQGAHGSVTFNNTSVTYTSGANYNGSDSFSYTMSDGNGGSATATVAITVNPVNDPPAAANDAATTLEDTAVTIDILANDSDPDGDALTVESYTLGGGATGTVTLNPDKTLTYTPGAHYNGNLGYITYQVSDGSAQAMGVVSLNVTAVNDAPSAENDSGATAEDSAVSVSVLSNDSDPDGDSLSVTAVTQGANGSVTFGANSVTYTPAANFSGADSFSYTIDDGNGGNATATVSITVSAANDNPVAGNDAGNTNEDTAVSIGVLSNDSDLDGDSLSVTATTQGANGTVTFNAGLVIYTPNANFNGADSFSYTIGDGNGGSATAAVSITVNAANDAPDAVNDAAATNEDAAVNISVLANDADMDGEAVTLIGVTQGARGSVAQNGNGTVTYTPNPNTFGIDNFTYTVRDAAGLTDIASVTVNVVPVNDPPDAINDSATVNEGSNVSISVLTNDVDIESNALTITAVSTPAHGTATINGNAITYTPVSTYSGPDSFTYTMSDGAATDTATVTMQVKDVIGNVAVLGTHSVWIQTGADVLSGDVVVNAAGSAPFLNSTEVSIAGSGASTATGWDVQGNRVTIASGATVASDVYYNQLTNSGVVSGAQYTPLSLPVFATLPAFLSASPGSSDVNVANNGSRTLAPGSYRDLIVGRKGTVTFTGGTYHFRSILVDREAKLLFSGGSQVRVQQKVSTNTLTTIGPSSGSSVTAAAIVFYVAGINGTTGTLSATPKAVEIGTDNAVSANIYAPNGTLWLKDRVQATGSFLGRDVQVGVNGQVSLRSAW